MTIHKKYLFFALTFVSFFSFGQSIDPSILSQLSPEQIESAKKMYELEDSTDIQTLEPPIVDESLTSKESISDANQTIGKKYGYDFFSSMPTSLTAVADLPLPNDYRISLRDQFTVILSGSKDSIFDLNVKLDGTILFPELGSVYVAGLTFKEVKEKLEQLIEKAYIGVNIEVSLKNLSAKKITIVGAVKTPGTYLVNPFSTITGALAYSGGISEIGSLRDIKLIRNNKEISSFDLYDLLIKGDRSKDLTIEAGDTILINPASQFVDIEGAVKRPGIYEILEGETLENIVDFALGFTQIANKSNISIDFLDLNAAAIVKKNTNNLSQSLKDALSVEVFNYVSDISSSIEILGAVEQPGFYDLKEFSSLKDLLAALKFVDVYPWAAVLEQFDEKNLIQSSILFNINDPETYDFVELLPNSRIYFANINDRTFEVSQLSEDQIADYELTINHSQGSFKLPVFGNFYVKSFIDLLGLDMTDVEDVATYVNPLEDIVITEDYKKMQFTAKKYNTVTFRSPVNNLISVSISGAIEFPGTYILSDNSTVSDLYKLIGEFKDQALLEGIILTRETIRERQIKAIEKSKNDLYQAVLANSQEDEDFNELSILSSLSETIDSDNLGRLAGNFSPSSITTENTVLFDGDTIIVPKNPNTINVLGDVLNPIAFGFSDSLTVNSAIELAGGFQEYADKKRVYVIKANGLVVRASRNVFGGRIRLEPGDSVVVPRKIVTKNPRIQSLIPITQILSDLAFSAAAIENLSNNN